MSRPFGGLLAYMSRKTSIRGGSAAGPRLAIKAAVMVCALAGQSCLVPQSVDPIVESAHPPPHFVLGSIPSYLLVPVLQLYRQGSADQQSSPPCHCKLVLSIPSVQEDDPTVTLVARWFVDYDPNFPRNAVVFEDELRGDFNSAETVRSLNGHDFDADQLGIVTNGVHVVDVVLAESAAFDNSSTATRPHRAIRPGYTSAEHSFVVDVRYDPDLNRPHCPDVLPSVRVCQ